MKYLAATGTSSTATSGIKNPALGDTLSNLLNSGGGAGYVSKLVPVLVGIIFVVGMLLFFFQFILGAVGLIQSSGDKQAVEGARGKLVFSVVGFLLLLSVFALVKLIEAVFSINILSIDIGILHL